MTKRMMGALLLAMAVAAPAWAQGVTVEQPWTRAAAQGGVGGAFMTLKNAGAAADKLVSVTTPVAGKVELHQSSREGDVMRMRPVTGIEVPAGGSVTLAPGGLHVMMMGLTRPLAPGERVPLTLTFEKAGAVQVEAAVQPAGARDAGQGHGGMRH